MDEINDENKSTTPWAAQESGWGGCAGLTHTAKMIHR